MTVQGVSRSKLLQLVRWGDGVVAVSATPPATPYFPYVVLPVSSMHLFFLISFALFSVHPSRNTCFCTVDPCYNLWPSSLCHMSRLEMIRRAYSFVSHFSIDSRRRCLGAYTALYATSSSRSRGLLLTVVMVNCRYDWDVRSHSSSTYPRSQCLHKLFNRLSSSSSACLALER